MAYRVATLTTHTAYASISASRKRPQVSGLGKTSAIASCSPQKTQSLSSFVRSLSFQSLRSPRFGSSAITSRTFNASVMKTQKVMGSIVEELGFGKESTSTEVADWLLSKDYTMKGKTVFITGSYGEKSLGFEMARVLGGVLGAEVLLACRTASKANEAADKLNSLIQDPSMGGSYTAQPWPLDLSSLNSVREFCQAYQKEGRELDVIIPNAGVAFVQNRAKTEDGFESHFGINHLGHFLLMQTLMKYLRKDREGSRVVVTASEMHRGSDTFPVDLDYDDLSLNQVPDPMVGATGYSRSKLANVMFANELRNQVKDSESPFYNPQAKIYTVCPGFVRTNLDRYMPDTPEVKAMKEKMYSDENPALKTIPQGAANTILCAALPTMPEGYYTHCQPKDPSEVAQNEAKIQELWNRSMELTESFDS